MPLLATLIISAMLLVLDRIRRLFDFVATEGGPISVVWRMLANLLPEYLGLGIPIGLLIGVLLAFRRLATSSELDVFRAVGVSYTRMLRVPYMYAVVLAIANFMIVGYLQPDTRYNYEKLRFELRTGALGASIKVGEFTHFPNGATVRIEHSQDGGRQLSGIFVQYAGKKGDWYAVSADQGRFLATDDPDEIIFRLTNGTLINNAPGFVTPRVLTFTSHDLPIPLPKYDSFRGQGESSVERRLPQLIAIGHDARASEHDRDSSRAAYHYRLAEVVSIFLMPLLALALGIPPKRSTSALGLVLSVILIVAWHKINEYGQAVSSLGKVDPILALWGPFVVFSLLIGWMYYTIAFVPGGQPIGALERWFSKFAKAIAKLLPARRTEGQPT